MRRFGKLLLVVFALTCVLTTTVFAEGDAEIVNVVYGTIVSLLPLVVAIDLTLITKEVYSSLLLGIPIGCLLQVDGNSIDAFQLSVSHPCPNAGGNTDILVFLVILDTMVVLIIRAGGSEAYGDWAVSHIKTKSGVLWSTFILVIVLGVNDYFNNLTTDNMMRPVADSHHISRAKSSYTCDITVVPVCIIVPTSSWATAAAGVIGNGEVGFQVFLRVIPFNYYTILTLVFTIVMTCPDIGYGPMRTHELNAVKGDLYTTPKHPFRNAVEMESNPGGKIIDLVTPVIILIIGCVSLMIYVGFQNGGHDLITAFANTSAFNALPLGLLIALITNTTYFMVCCSMKFTKLMDCLSESFERMVPAILILYPAWTIGDMTRGPGAPEFVAGIVRNLSGSLYALLPAVVFIIATFLGLATGTSWDTFSILLPTVVPVFSGNTPVVDLTMDNLNNNLLMIPIAITLSGAVMDDHCSLVSDATIMASSGAQYYHLNHAATQLSCAVTVTVVTLVSYIITAFIQIPFICLPIAVVSMVLVVLVISEVNHSMNRYSQRD